MLVGWALVLLALQGCAVYRDSAATASDADLSRLKTIHVVRAPDDEHGVYIYIVDQLRRMGYQPSSGTTAQAPADTDALLHYQTRRQWDPPNYLLDATLRAPKSGALLATATSYNTSMTRKSTEEIVAEVLSNLLKGSKPQAAGGRVLSDNALVQLKPYVAAPLVRGGAASGRGAVQLEPVRDARGNNVGALIGERTTRLGILDLSDPFGDRTRLPIVSLGIIELTPLPTQAVAEVLNAELGAAGFAPGGGAGSPRVAVQVNRFVVTTPATVLYWDIQGAVDIDLRASGAGGDVHQARYQASCSDRTFVYPSAELIGGVVQACLQEIGGKLRSDAALWRVLDAR